jgi:hypothetical protein
MDDNYGVYQQIIKPNPEKDKLRDIEKQIAKERQHQFDSEKRDSKETETYSNNYDNRNYDSRESQRANSNHDQIKLAHLNSDDINELNFDSTHTSKNNLITPNANYQPNKVSFNDNVSTIREFSEDKTKRNDINNKSSFADAKSTGLRQIIYTINENTESEPTDNLK